MDSMELEREKGITIQSAATFTQWDGHHINIIDTPGHVDFTIEVERALRVLDGAILVICSVGSVQSQTQTVVRQMNRYNVPRLVFINKLDRAGANPDRIINDIRNKLKMKVALVQIPIGLEDDHKGVIDLVENKAYFFEGDQGTDVVEKEIPAAYKETAENYKKQLIDYLSNIDEELEDLFLMEEVPTDDQLRAAIRRQTLALKFAPVFMGSAFKNKGVQPLLDGVVKYLPNPSEVSNYAFAIGKSQTDETKFTLQSDHSAPLVALAFKLEKNRFGQLTYMRIYQGSIKRGQYIWAPSQDNQRFKVPRLVRMHSNEMEEIDGVGPGEIVAMFGIDCPSGTTFTDGKMEVAMSSMFVPEPVMSYSIKPKEGKDSDAFQKAMTRFTAEDPTFHLQYDSETAETIISGMGELHLQIYVERLLREYNVPTVVGPPRVRYRERITTSARFDYLHKKQTGGNGQYGRVIGYIEPIEESKAYLFENQLIGDSIPPQLITSVEKGFKTSVTKGPLTGAPIEGIRIVLEDGASHPVDSNDRAFQAAAEGAFRQCYSNAQPIVLQPIMTVEVECPAEFQSDVVSGLNKRRGTIRSANTVDGEAKIIADIPLVEMFGYSSVLRSCTEGKGTFSMEYLEHAAVAKDQQAKISAEYLRSKADDEARA
eukprot:TRINITY_DN2828_c0_g1_i1.p1 TRINITY_DN2828_c0_g1~~TRINITY_DN2828_c0_g1_i1.p1  ORF type:complete len:751 (-),score=235.54 TRINITY_DN2828_c0_g1_i1:1410-3371(-)